MIVWAIKLTMKPCVTGVAAAYALLPVWLARIVQVPPAINIAVEPDTVHTPGVIEEKLTGRPELDVPTRGTVELTI